MSGEGAKAAARALVKLSGGVPLDQLSPMEKAAFFELTRVMRVQHLEAHTRPTLQMNAKTLGRLTKIIG